MRRSAPSHEGWADTSPSRRAAVSETLAGLVERVTFHNPDNGFCVLRVKARGQRDLVTVVGHAPVISAGEFVQATGIWTNDRTHGPQFKASFLRAAPPTTLEGIEKYLGSGMIRGIGPDLRQTAGAGVRRGGVRRHRGAARAAPAGRGHRPQARREDRRWVGRSEGDPRDHDLPALARCQHVALGADLQDLRRRRHPGALGEPLPPRP